MVVLQHSREMGYLFLIEYAYCEIFVVSFLRSLIATSLLLLLFLISLPQTLHTLLTNIGVLGVKVTQFCYWHKSAVFDF